MVKRLVVDFACMLSIVVNVGKGVVPMVVAKKRKVRVSDVRFGQSPSDMFNVGPTYTSYARTTYRSNR